MHQLRCSTVKDVGESSLVSRHVHTLNGGKGAGIMDHVTKSATNRLVIVFGAAVLTAFSAAETHAGGKTRTPPANAATVTVKNVTIEQVDEAGGTISVSFGKKDKLTKLTNVPLEKRVRLVASHVLPGSVNHLPFRWDNLKRLEGKVVSVRLYVAVDGLSVVSIAAGND